MWKQPSVNAQESLYEHAFYHSPIGMAIVNLNGTILKVNPAVCQLLGFEERELVNKTFQDITYYNDIKENERLFDQLIHDEIPSYKMEKRYINKQGETIWGLLSVSLVRDNANKPLYLISQVQDITLQKQAISLMEQNAKRYKDLVELSPDGVVITRDGHCLYANRTFLKMIGAGSKEDIIGRYVYDFIPEEIHTEFQELVKKVDQGLPTGIIRGKLLCLDGKPLEIEVKVTPTYYEDQNARHFIIRDISEKVQFEELMLHSEKLAVAGQLAAGIAHEVRNPLTAIKGFLQLLNNQLDHIPYIDVIFSEINRIESILTELLIVAKPQSTKFQKEHLNPILENVVALLTSQAIIKNITIHLIISETNLFIFCDSNQIKQVFINLIKNAIEAMPKGGNIYIEAEQLTTHITIKVKDEGTGIPNEQLVHIGEPFYTTKEGGTGLGLLVCKKIIENHKGNIALESSSQGTTITIDLPLDQLIRPSFSKNSNK